MITKITTSHIGTFAFNDNTTKQTKMDDGIYARLQTIGSGSGYSILYFVNNDGREIEVPTCFYIHDITDTNNIKILYTVRRDKHFFVLLWTNSYEMSYSGKKSMLMNERQWTTKGAHSWNLF